MKRYRYGTFRFGDYWETWVSVTIFLLAAIATVMLDLSFIFLLFSLVYALFWLWAILAPQFEKFAINGNSITVYRGKKKHSINLPSELVLVVSYADIAPPFAVRTVIDKQTHILKNKFAVTILKQMPQNTVLESLHRNYLEKYTMSTIQNNFNDHRYIYSFVCDQDLFNELVSNKNYQIIVPKTLLNQITIDLHQTNVHVDTEG